MRLRRFRLFLGCLVFSLLFHFTAGPLLLWLFGGRAPAAPQESVFYARSSALRISRLTRPVPMHRPVERRAQPATRQPLAHPVPRHVAMAERQEISVPRLNAQTAPQRRGATVNISQDEAQFEKTIAKLRQENDPVAAAARPVSNPEASKRFSFNIAGAVNPGPHQQGILIPMPGSPWRQDGYDYYYVRYWVEYADGSTETGIVPWPLRYFPRSDPFRNGDYHIPLPLPLPDYQLPPGTVLHPLVAFCYAHRNELNSCPIAHG